jgi:hypothetical protein
MPVSLAARLSEAQPSLNGAQSKFRAVKGCVVTDVHDRSLSVSDMAAASAHAKSVSSLQRGIRQEMRRDVTPVV